MTTLTDPVQIAILLIGSLVFGVCVPILIVVGIIMGLWYLLLKFASTEVPKALNKYGLKLTKKDAGIIQIGTPTEKWEGNINNRSFEARHIIEDRTYEHRRIHSRTRSHHLLLMDIKIKPQDYDFELLNKEDGEEVLERYEETKKPGRVVFGGECDKTLALYTNNAVKSKQLLDEYLTRLSGNDLSKLVLDGKNGTLKMQISYIIKENKVDSYIKLLLAIANKIDRT